ncbi:MAG: hypothetical protein OEV40_17425, partial [Acidimicrobiia bacterium]|nr:hypothetical protein [Acidimicrobiia bacterium]
MPAPTGLGPGGQPQPLHQPSPLQARPFAGTGGQPTQPARSNRSERLRVFGAAFGATLLVGGLLIFVISRITRGDEGSTPSDVTTVATLSPETDRPDRESGAAIGDDTADPAGAEDQESSGLTELSDLGDQEGDNENETGGDGAGQLTPLALPLGVEDFGLGEPTLTQADTDGPAVPQYCDNTPVTTGLVDWEGETYSDAAGFPVVFQELVRFDTAAQASAYMASYVATVNCSEWVIPGEEGGPDVVVRPEVVAVPAANHGDATEEITFEAQADFLTLVARAALVRKNTDVYLMSVTSILTSDVDELDRLLALAIDLLGY